MKKLDNISKKALIFEAQDEKSFSKIGGNPNIKIDNDKLTLIAQIDCSKLKNNLLPKKGLLCFFVDVEFMLNNILGSSDLHKSKFKVLYLKEESIEEEYISENSIEEIPLKFSKEQKMYPLEDYFERDEIQLTEDEEENFDKIIDEYFENIYIHMLGYPLTCNSDIRYDCDLVDKGYDLMELGYSKIDEKIVSMESTKWINLLQYTNNKYQIICDNLDSIYFLIKENDLVKMNFNNVWCMATFF